MKHYLVTARYGHGSMRPGFPIKKLSTTTTTEGLLVFSIGPPLFATVMACSDDRALGRVPRSSGSDGGTGRRTLSLRVLVLLLLGLGRRWGCRRLCLR